MRSFPLFLLFMLSTIPLMSQWTLDIQVGTNEAIGAWDNQHFGLMKSSGLYKTTNGGQSFDQLDLLNESGLQIFGVTPTDLVYSSPNVLYCSVYFVSNEFEGILKSVNGGASWEYVHEQTSGLADLQLNSLYLDEGTLYAGGKNGKFMTSNSNGQFWDTQFIPSVGEVRDIWASGQNIYVVGDNGISISENGGVLWDFTATETPARAVTFNGVDELMVAIADAQIIRIPLGGGMWIYGSTPFTDLNGVSHIENDSWLISNNEFLWRSDDNGETWSIQAFRANQNWPFLSSKKDNGVYLARQQNVFWWTTDEPETLENLASLDGLELPEILCPGVSTIEVVVTNIGASPITELSFDVTYDDIDQGSVSWSGLIEVGSTEVLEIEVDLPFRSSSEELEVVLVNVNGELNVNFNGSTQLVQTAVNGLGGEVVIGSGGDYDTFEEFRIQSSNAPLCESLTVLFENGTYEADIFLNIQQLGNSIYIGALDQENPSVTLLGSLTLSDISEGASVICENINFQSSISFPNIELELNYFDQAVVRNCSFLDDAQTSSALSFLEVNHATVDGSNFLSEEGIFFNSDLGDSLRVTNSSFETSSYGIASGDADYAEILNNTFNSGSSSFRTGSGRFIKRTIIGNNRSYSENNAGQFSLNTVFGQATEDVSLEFFNNICVQQGDGRALSSQGNVQIMNNTFIGLGENAFQDGIALEFPGEVSIKGNIFHYPNQPIGRPYNNGTLLNLQEGSLDFNVYFSSVEDPFGVSDENSGLAALQAFQNDFNQDQNSVWVEPEFQLDAQFQPMYDNILVNENNAPFIDFGTYENPFAQDIQGLNRVYPYDAGPFELNGSVQDGGITDLMLNADCDGNITPSLTVTNFGTDPISSIAIEWFINGESQGTESFDIELAVLGNVQVEFDTYSFQESEATPVAFELISVNGDLDLQTSNNVWEASFTPLSDAPIHVGENQPYQSLQAALDTLVQRGMCADLEIIVHPGIYTVDQGDFNFSETDQVTGLTIRSLNNDPTEAEINLPTEGLIFTDGPHLDFQDLQFVCPDTAFITLNGAISDVLLSRCRLNGRIKYNTDSGMENAVTEVRDCEYFDGAYEIIDARSPVVPESVVFSGNSVSSSPSVFSGLNLDGVEGLIMEQNVFRTRQSLIARCVNISNVIAKRNDIVWIGSTGLFVSFKPEAEGTALIENNYFDGNLNFVPRALFIQGSSLENHHATIIHNTFRSVNRSIRGNSVGLTIQNNILGGVESAVYTQEADIPFIVSVGNIFNGLEGVAFEIWQNPFALDEWRMMTENDLASIEADLEFLEDEGYQTNDILADGVFNPVALPLSVDIDIEGNDRDLNAPDVGCYAVGGGQALIDLAAGEVTLTGESCTNGGGAIASFTNEGQETITSFVFHLEDGQNFTASEWQGTLLAGESLEFELPNFVPLIQEDIELYLSVQSVNGIQQDINQFNDSTVTEIEGFSIGGLLIIGDFPNVSFAAPQDLINYLQVIPPCADLEVLVAPGSYPAMNIEDLDLQGYSLELRSLFGDPEQVRITEEGTPNDPSLQAISSEAISFRDVTFEGENFIDLELLGPGWSFEDCHFRISDDALIANDVDGLIVSGCEIDGRLTLVNCDDGVIARCYSEGGIEIVNSKFCLVDNNEVNPMEFANNATYNGLEIRQDCRGSVVSNNRVVAENYRALYINDSCGCPEEEYPLIYNNVLIQTNNGSSVSAGPNSGQFKFYHNTVQANDFGRPFVSTSVGFQIDISNNILAGENSAALSYFGTQANTFKVRNNILWSSNAGSVEEVPDVQAFNELTAFETSGNVNINPMLNNGSVAQNEEIAGLGVGLGVQTDILGNERDSLIPTPGAFEVLAAAPVPGDLTGDGVVNASDLLTLLSEFGCGGCVNSDLNGDGLVNMADLLELLSLL